MQDKQLAPPKEKTPISKWWRVVKSIITLLVISYIYSVFNREQKGFHEIFNVLFSVIRSGKIPLLFVMFGLVPLNWMLESLKWKLLAQKAIQITFREAFRSTMMGLAVGVAVPAQLGDTLGRIASLRSKHRLRTLGAALISNGIQFYVSVLGGAISWFIISARLPISHELKNGIVSFLAIIILGGFVIGIFRANFVNWKTRRIWVLKLKKNLQVIKRYSNYELFIALLAGTARYLVFVLQFVLAFSLFDFSISFLELFGCVGLILLTKTLLPVINVIGDLGVREFTALYVFAPFHLSPEKVVAATFLIWLVNILGPMLVGLVLIWKNKWSTKYV